MSENRRGDFLTHTVHLTKSYKIMQDDQSGPYHKYMCFTFTHHRPIQKKWSLRSHTFLHPQPLRIPP